MLLDQVGWWGPSCWCREPRSTYPTLKPESWSVGPRTEKAIAHFLANCEDKTLVIECLSAVAAAVLIGEVSPIVSICLFGGGMASRPAAFKTLSKMPLARGRVLIGHLPMVRVAGLDPFRRPLPIESILNRARDRPSQVVDGLAIEI